MIAAQLHCNDQTVRNVITAFNADGLSVLKAGSHVAHQLPHGDTRGISKALSNLAWSVFSLGDEEQALAYWEQSLRLARETDDTCMVSVALVSKAVVARQRGEYKCILPLLKETMHLFYQGRDLVWLKNSFYESGFTHIGLRQAACAVRLWGAADRIVETIGYQASPHELAENDRYRAEAIAQIGEDAVAAAYDEGRAMSLDQAVADALDDVNVPEG